MKPDDAYLLKLGLAHYWFQYVEWAVIYALHDATGEDVSVLTTQTPRHLSNKLNDAWHSDPTLAMLAGRYAELVTNREHLAHSHPATHDHAAASEQRLRRHDIKHRTRPPTQFWITPEWLDGFAAAARALNRDLTHRPTINSPMCIPSEAT